MSEAAKSSSNDSEDDTNRVRNDQNCPEESNIRTCKVDENKKDNGTDRPASDDNEIDNKSNESKNPKLSADADSCEKLELSKIDNVVGQSFSAEKRDTDDAHKGINCGPTNDFATENNQREEDKALLSASNNDEMKDERVRKGELEDVDIPIDRGWAWMVVLGAFCMHIVVIGGCKSFGVLFVVFQDKYSVSAGPLSSVMSLPICLLFALSVFANMLSAKLTCRLVVFIGGILGCCGFFLTAFMSDFIGVIFTFGIIGGVGFSLCYGPCVVMVGQHFRKYRSLANGIAVAGSGVGTFVIPNLIRVLVREYGVEGCLIIFSGIVLNISVFALLFRPWSNYRRKERVMRIMNDSDSLEAQGKSWNGDNATGENGHPCKERDSDDCELGDFVRNDNSEVNKIYDVHAESNCNEEVDYDCEEEITEGLIANGDKGTKNQQVVSSRWSKSKGDINISDVDIEIEYDNNHERKAKDPSKPFKMSESGANERGVVVGRSVAMESKKKKLLDWTLLFHPVFFIYALSSAFATPGYGHVFVMLPDYAEENGHSRDTSALITSIIGISDLAGRLFFGWFSDLNLIPKRWGFIGCMACSAVLNLILPQLSSFPGLVCYAVAFGMFSGSFITLTPVLLAEDLGTERLGSSFGLTNMLMAVAFLSGPPICGLLKDSTGSWNAAFYFVGALTFLGAILPVFQPQGQRWVEARERRKQQSTPASRDE